MSPISSRALFSVEDLKRGEWELLLDRAAYYSQKPSILNQECKPSVGLVFFESSSRTRWSFHKAALDLNLRTYETVVDQTTSLSKGETVKDSLELFLNLGYDLVIGRTPEVPELRELLSRYKVSYINAGYGSEYHPTQAFLDYYTWTQDAKLKSPKVLIVGDVKHSRVARSHFRFSNIMDYKVGVLSPKSFEVTPDEVTKWNLTKFSDRNEAFEWADIIYLLRNQKERHQGSVEDTGKFKPFSCAEIREDQYVMHPGPFIRGEDLEDSVLEDSRNLIFAQKQNGVYCRTAILEFFFNHSSNNYLNEENQK